MNDLSIHPGRAKYGKAYNPSLSLDENFPVSVPAKDRTKGKLGKVVRKLEERRKWFNNLPANVQASHTMPGSMK